MTDQVKLRPGDIIVFDGGNADDVVSIVKNIVSDTIQVITHSMLTHCAMVWDFDLPINGQPQNELHLLESTIRDGISGPQLTPLADRLAEYTSHGRVWALLLSDRARAFLDFGSMWNFAATKLSHDRYNVAELLLYLARHVPIVQEIPRLYQSDDDSEVCSELVAMLLRAGGLPGLRPATMPPQAIAELRIYRECVQLCGQPKGIRNFNTV